MSALFSRLRQLVEAEQPVALAKVIQAPRDLGAEVLVPEYGEPEGEFPFPMLRDRVIADARAALRRGQAQTSSYDGPEGEQVSVFFDVYPAPPTLLIFGGVHVGVTLCHLAKDLGFRVRVIDARGRFATRERFPEADEVIISHADDYLQEHRLGSSSYVAVLSHDPKLDDPALLYSLQSNARYVGAIGSKKTNAARMQRLLKKGLSEEQLARLHGGPVGLDIGAQNPEEIALSILAEMVAAKNGVLTRPGARAGAELQASAERARA